MRATRPSSPVPLVEDPRVTVVVASRDRREELVASIREHRAPVILMDNASTDGSAPVVRRVHPWVEVVEVGRNLGAHARTLGVARARTPYVAFADDDSWWAPGSLRAAADLLDREPEVAVVAGRILVGADEHPDSFCDVLAASPLHGTGGRPRLLGFVACAAMVRRDHFLEAGGFDDVVRFPGEEERLALDLAAAGRQIVYADDVVVHHHPSPARHSPDRRVRAITRSAVLTAAMRLPWRDVVGRVREALAAGPATRAGARDAARELPAALRRRRVVPRHVLADLATLRAQPSPLPAPGDDVVAGHVHREGEP